MEDSKATSSLPASTTDSQSTEEITDRVSTFSHFSKLEEIEAPTQLQNGDFETGDLSGWYKETEGAPFDVCSDDVDIWDNKVCKHGQFFLGFGKSNYSGENETKTGRIRSSLFRMSGNHRITFSLAGSNQEKISCYLMEHNSGGTDRVITRFNNVREGLGGLSGFIMVPYFINLPTSYEGKTLYFVLEDNATSGFAFINLDNIKTYDTDPKPIFASSAASYVNVANPNDLVKGSPVTSIEARATGQRFFKLGEDFNADSLVVLATHENGLQMFMNPDDFLVNHAQFDKSRPGTYTIEIMCKSQFIKTEYQVRVLEAGQEAPGVKEVKSDSELLIIGDSQMDFWDNAKADIGVFNNVTNIALGGTQLPYWLNKVDQVCSNHPPFILMNIGGNDIRNGGFSAEEVAANLKTFIDQVKEKSPTSQIYLFSTPMSPATYYNFCTPVLRYLDLAAKLSEEATNLTLIDVSRKLLTDDGLPKKELFRDDSLHYLSSSYSILAEAFRKYLKTT